MMLLFDKGLNNCPNKELQAAFDRLCDEQEKIDCTGFGKVFECLNEIVLQGANHPVLYPFTDNVEAMQTALEMTGHSKDEAFWAQVRKSVDSPPGMLTKRLSSHGTCFPIKK